MNIFYRPKYQSEATQFLESLKAKDPQLDAKRLQGLARCYGTKPVDREIWTDYRAAPGQSKALRLPDQRQISIFNSHIMPCTAL
jgi:hypothetical protein